MFKVNIRIKCAICLKLTLEVPDAILMVVLKEVLDEIEVNQRSVCYQSCYNYQELDVWQMLQTKKKN